MERDSLQGIMLKKTIVALFASSLCLAACGGGDGGGSGVDGTKTVSTLTDAEIIQVCEYAEGLINESHLDSVECYVESILGSQNGDGDCQTMYDACIAGLEPDTDPSDCATAATDPLPDCGSMVTLSEVETCLKAEASQLNGVSVNCSTPVSELENLFELPEPASCVALEEKCPGLVD